MKNEALLESGFLACTALTLSTDFFVVVSVCRRILYASTNAMILS